MRRYPRARRRAKWSGLVLSLAILLAWIVTLRHSVLYTSGLGSSGYLQLGLGAGAVFRDRLGSPRPSFWGGQ